MAASSTRFSTAVATRSETGSWFRLTTERRGQVANRADGPILPTAFEADGSESCISLRDADAEIEVVTELAPVEPQSLHFLAHCQTHPDGRSAELGTGMRSLKKIIIPSPAKCSKVRSYS